MTSMLGSIPSCSRHGYRSGLLCSEATLVGAQLKLMCSYLGLPDQVVFVPFKVMLPLVCARNRSQGKVVRDDNHPAAGVESCLCLLPAGGGNQQRSQSHRLFLVMSPPSRDPLDIFCNRESGPPADSRLLPVSQSASEARFRLEPDILFIVKELRPWQRCCYCGQEQQQLAGSAFARDGMVCRLVATHWQLNLHDLCLLRRFCVCRILGLVIPCHVSTIFISFLTPQEHCL